MRGMSDEFAQYLATQLRKRSWSRRTLAMHADVSHTAISQAVKGETTPSPDTVRKIAVALGADEAYLLRLAGHLGEIPQQISDPSVFEIAQRLDGLPPDLRREAVRAGGGVIDTYDNIQQRHHSMGSGTTEYNVGRGDEDEET